MTQRRKFSAEYKREAVARILAEAGFRLDHMEVVFLDSPELAQQAIEKYRLHDVNAGTSGSAGGES